VLRWSAAADRARLQARRASERTAAASSAAMAVRFEREAEIHLKAALCHELAAVALFASDEAVTALAHARFRNLTLGKRELVSRRETLTDQELLDRREAPQ
jgi:hypothetical protein